LKVVTRFATVGIVWRFLAAHHPRKKKKKEEKEGRKRRKKKKEEKDNINNGRTRRGWCTTNHDHTSEIIVHPTSSGSVVE